MIPSEMATCRATHGANTTERDPNGYADAVRQALQLNPNIIKALQMSPADLWGIFACGDAVYVPIGRGFSEEAENRLREFINQRTTDLPVTLHFVPPHDR